MPTPRKFGWKRSAPDPRDRQYAAPYATVENLPEKVDLLAPAVGVPLDPCWNQAGLSSCGPHAVCEDWVFAALKIDGAASVAMPSRLFAYYVTRLLQDDVDDDEGVNNRTLMKAMARYGVCDESLWPYDEGKFADEPPPEAFAQAATRKVTEYLAVPQALDQMRGCLADGKPFILGFDVYEGMMTDEAEATGMVPLPRRREKKKGGHDVLAVGYDDRTQLVKFRNHWRREDETPWGVEGGCGFLPYAYVCDHRLAGDYWRIEHARLGPAA